MITFTPPIAPSPGTKSKPEIKLLKADFGDGYTQVVRDGLNHIRQVQTLVWERLLPDQAEIILAFLVERGGDQAFLYAVGAGPVRKWTCEEWEHSYTSGGTRSITATFRQNFNFGG